MEQESQQRGIAEYFSGLEDPRWHNKRHELLDIVVIASCFMLTRRVPYLDPGANYGYQQYQARVLRHLNQRAAKLGPKLEPSAADRVSV